MANTRHVEFENVLESYTLKAPEIGVDESKRYEIMAGATVFNGIKPPYYF